jgi:hypothetical protein
MTDQSADARAVHYAALLSALAGTRRDPATDRFDEELAAAEAAGAIDPHVARTLRWWQRESVRAVEEHLQAVLPGVIVGLERADAEAAQAVADSAESWAAASGRAMSRPLPPPDDPGPVGAAQSGPAPLVPGSGGGSPHGPVDPTTPYLRPVDRVTGDARGPTAEPSAVLRPGFAPPEPPATRGPVAHDSPGGGAPPRRLLVAGLTVLPDDASHDSTEHDRPSTPRDDSSGDPR